eukprot:scaffold6821_cov81-Skeletonema_dohrnii-CCMP3373.AAC.1
MANYNGSLEAVDCQINSVRYDMVLEGRAGGRLRCLISVRYDMVLEGRAGGRLRCLIRSPTTL